MNKNCSSELRVKIKKIRIRNLKKRIVRKIKKEIKSKNNEDVSNNVKIL